MAVEWLPHGLNLDGAICSPAPGMKVSVVRDMAQRPGLQRPPYIIRVFGHRLPQQAATLEDGKALALKVAVGRARAALAALEAAT